MNPRSSKAQVLQAPIEQHPKRSIQEPYKSHFLLFVEFLSGLVIDDVRVVLGGLGCHLLRVPLTQQPNPTTTCSYFTYNKLQREWSGQVQLGYGRHKLTEMQTLTLLKYLTIPGEFQGRVSFVQQYRNVLNQARGKIQGQCAKVYKRGAWLTSVVFFQVVVSRRSAKDAQQKWTDLLAVDGGRR